MDILIKLFFYAQMLQQKFSSITHIDVVSNETEVLEMLKLFKQNDIGLYFVEPEIPKEGRQDQWQDVAYMQLLLISKIPDRIKLKEKIQQKNNLYNLCRNIDLTLMQHKEDTSDFNYQFSNTNEALPDYDPVCYLMPHLDVASIQKTPIPIVKDYIGWTITFKTKVQ